MKRFDISNDIPRLQKEYGDQRTYLYADFIGAINGLEKLYLEPEFFKVARIGKPDFDPTKFEQDIFSNIAIILDSIKENAPDITRVQKGIPKINIAFCRNLWLHELLLDESWKDEEEKRDYMLYAFQEIFHEFDTKAASDFTTEFFPYDMPWASVAYHPLENSDRSQLEMQVYQEFFQPKLEKEQSFHAHEVNELRLNDQLNFALRIANKLKDYKRRFFYFDLKRFHLYSEFSQIKESGEKSKTEKEIHQFLLYYEFKRAMIWNALFLLKAGEFRELLDFLRGQNKLEEMRRKESKERKKELAKALRQTKMLEFQQATSQEQQFGDFGMKMPTPLGSSITQPMEFELPEPEPVERAVLLDKEQFDHLLGEGLNIREVSFLFDNMQILEERDKKYLDRLCQGKKDSKLTQKVKTPKVIDRSASGSPEQVDKQTTLIDWITKPTATIEPVSNDKITQVLPYLISLKRFDQNLVELIAKKLNLDWNDSDWKQFGEQSWLWVHSKKWFYIKQTKEAGSVATIPISEFPKEWRQEIFSSLWNTKEKKREGRQLQLDALEYGFVWKQNKVAQHWLKFWLLSLRALDFDMAQQALILAFEHLENVLEALDITKAQFHRVTTEIHNGIEKNREKQQTFNKSKQHKNKKQQSDSPLNKKERKEWLKQLGKFCELSFQFAIDENTKILFFAAAANLLKQFSDTQETWDAFSTYCEDETILQHFSNNPAEYRWFLIELYLQCLPQSDKIEKHLREFLNYSQENEEGFFRRFVAAERLGNPEILLKAVEEYLQFTPDNADLLATQINLLLALGRFDDAKEKVDHSLTSKQNFTLRLLRGKVLLASGEKEDFEKWYQTMIDDITLSSQQRAAVICLLAKSFDNEQLDKKQELYEQTLELDPNHFGAATGLIELFIKKESPENAKKVFEQFPKQEGIEGLLFQLQYYQNMNDQAKVLSLIDQLAAPSGKNKEFIIMKAVLLVGMAQPQQAIKILKEYLKSNPHDKMALWILLPLQFQSVKPQEIEKTIHQLNQIAPLTREEELRIASFYLSEDRASEGLRYLKKLDLGEKKNEAVFYRIKIQLLQNAKKIDELLQISDIVLELFPNDVDLLTVMAYGLYQSNRFQDALTFLKKILDFEPKRHDIWNLKGACLSYLNKYEKALASFDHAIFLSPKYSESWSNKGGVQSELKQYKKALEALEQAIRLNPKNINAWLNKGKTYNDLKQYDKALKAFEQAIRLNSKIPEAWINKSAAYTGLKQYEKALDASEQAIRLNSKIPGAWINKSITHYILKQYEKALEASEQAIQIDPKNLDAWIRKGVTYINLKQYEKALEASEQVILLNPKNPRVWITKSVVHSNLKQHEKTLESLEQAIRLDPKNPNAWGRKGASYVNLEQYERALEAFEQAIQLDPTNTNTWIDKSAVYSNLKQHEKTLKALEHAIRLDPKNPDAWIRKGGAYVNLKQYEKALESYEQAIRLDSTNFYCWNGKGVCLIQLKEHEKALEAYEKSLELEPDNQKALTKKLFLLIILGREAETSGLFEKALAAGDGKGDVWYDRACAYAITERLELALSDLKQAIELDEEYRTMAQEDKDFDSIRSLPDFQELVNLEKE